MNTPGKSGGEEYGQTSASSNPFPKSGLRHISKGLKKEEVRFRERSPEMGLVKIFIMFVLHYDTCCFSAFLICICRFIILEMWCLKDNLPIRSSCRSSNSAIDEWLGVEELFLARLSVVHFEESLIRFLNWKETVDLLFDVFDRVRFFSFEVDCFVLPSLNDFNKRQLEF